MEKVSNMDKTDHYLTLSCWEEKPQTSKGVVLLVYTPFSSIWDDSILIMLTLMIYIPFQSSELF